VKQQQFTHRPATSRAGDGTGDSAGEFAEVFRRHHHSLRGYAATFRVPGMTADDLVGEAALRVLRTPGRQCIGHQLGYLRAVIRNIAAERTGREKPLMFVDDTRVLDRHGPATDDPGTPTEEIRAAFRSLPQRWRLVLFRLIVAGDPIQDVAADLQLTPNALRSLAHRARRGLRDALLDDGSGIMPALAATSGG